MSRAWRGVVVGGGRYFIAFRPRHLTGLFWYAYGWVVGDDHRSVRRLTLLQPEAMEWFDESRT